MFGYCLQEWREGQRYCGEVAAAYLSGQRNRSKKWRAWRRLMLVDCCGWVVNQDGVFVSKSECGQLEQEPDGQGALMEAGWATSHC